MIFLKKLYEVKKIEEDRIKIYRILKLRNDLEIFWTWLCIFFKIKKFFSQNPRPHYFRNRNTSTYLAYIGQFI